MSVIYYLIDLTRPQSVGWLTSAEAVHKAGANQAKLSITENVDGTEAVIKVVGNQVALQKPDPQGLVLGSYTKDQRGQIYDFIYTPAWLSPILGE